MTVDYGGIAVLIGALAAAFGSIFTAIMQWRNSTKMDKNKQEAIAAREQQTSTIIEKAVVPALNAAPPSSTDADGKGP